MNFTKNELLIGAVAALVIFVLYQRNQTEKQAQMTAALQAINGVQFGG